MLIFIPALAAHQVDQQTLLQSVLAFTIFSLIASAVYIINDLIDLQADRLHPRKCLRPFASGQATIFSGIILSLLLLLVGFGGALFLELDFLLILLTYFFLSLIYTFKLKQVMVIDLFTLTVLYVIRIFAGAVLTGIPLSIWLIAFSLFFFFSLAAVKRQTELLDYKERNILQIHGRGYKSSDELIIRIISIITGYISVMVLALYISSDNIMLLYQSSTYLWGICAIIFLWLNRIYFLTHQRKMNDDIVLFAVTDYFSLISLFIILFLMFAGAYL